MECCFAIPTRRRLFYNVTGQYEINEVECSNVKYNLREHIEETLSQRRNNLDELNAKVYRAEIDVNRLENLLSEV